jgi:hypothetical protein
LRNFTTNLRLEEQLMQDETPYTLEELRREIEIGRQEILRGEGIVLRGKEELRAFFDDIKRRGRERYEAALRHSGQNGSCGPQNSISNS